MSPCQDVCTYQNQKLCVLMVGGSLGRTAKGHWSFIFKSVDLTYAVVATLFPVDILRAIQEYQNPLSSTPMSLSA